MGENGAEGSQARLLELSQIARVEFGPPLSASRWGCRCAVTIVPSGESSLLACWALVANVQLTNCAGQAIDAAGPQNFPPHTQRLRVCSIRNPLAVGVASVCFILDPARPPLSVVFLHTISSQTLHTSDGNTRACYQPWTSSTRLPATASRARRRAAMYLVTGLVRSILCHIVTRANTSRRRPTRPIPRALRAGSSFALCQSHEMDPDDRPD